MNWIDWILNSRSVRISIRYFTILGLGFVTAMAISLVVLWIDPLDKPYWDEVGIIFLLIFAMMGFRQVHDHATKKVDEEDAE